jgi:large subunit ribosomal protein L24
MRRTSNKIPKLHIKTNDTVKILSGDDKGKTGRVLEVFPKERRAIVDGVNVITKHSKPSAKNPQGGRITQPAKVQVSKLMLVEPKSGLPSRIGRKENDKGKLVRTTKRSNEEI